MNINVKEKVRATKEWVKQNTHVVAVAAGYAIGSMAMLAIENSRSKAVKPNSLAIIKTDEEINIDVHKHS